MNQQSTKLVSLSLAFMVLLSVFAGSLALVGTAAAANASDYDNDAILADGGTYWVGQILFSNESTNSAAGETYEVHGTDSANSGYFQQVRVDSDGGLLLDTSDLEPGNYEVEDHNNVVLYNFTVAEQSFSVNTSDTDPSDTTYTFAFDSNRVGFDVIVESASFNATELESIFGSANGVVQNVDDDPEDEYVLTDVSDGDELPATFDKEDAGTHNFSFNVSDTNAGDSVDQFEVVEPNSATGEFSESLYSEEEGDIATFNVTLENTDTATVHVGDADIGYEASFNVTDGNDDGVVTVEFNSYAAGDGDSATTFSVVESQDSIDFSGYSAESTISNPPLDTGTYDLSLVVGNVEQDVAALILTDRATEGASAYVVPQGDKTNNPEDIRANAVAGSEVALGDKLVIEFEASGVFAQLDGVAAADLVEGSTFADDNGMHVIVEEQYPGMNRQPAELDVSDATLRQDTENDTFFLVFDTEDYPSLEDGDEYEVRFNMTEANGYIDDADENDAQDAAASFSVAERKATFDDYDKSDDIVYVQPSDGYTLSGTSTVAPGTELTVIARAEGESPFLYNEDVVVAEDGTFSTQFDFSGLSEGDEFTVEVRGFDPVDAQAVNAAPEKFNLSVNTVDENGETVNADVTLNGDAFDGEMLQNGTYTVSASADGYEAVSQEVTINGSESSVTLTLSPAKHDLTVSTVDENGTAIDANVTIDGEVLEGDSISLDDGTYTVEASADGYEAASQDVTIDGDAQSVTLTLAAEEMETETPTNETEEPSNNSSEPPTTEDPGQPGFGIVVALIALIGAALLATRRQE